MMKLQHGFDNRERLHQKLHLQTCRCELKNIIDHEVNCRAYRNFYDSLIAGSEDQDSYQN